MKEFFAKKSIGFYLGIVVAVLALVGLIIYSGDTRATSGVKTILILAIVLEVAYVAASLFLNNKFLDLASIVVAVLIAVAFVSGFTSQVDQLGWCVAGLDPWSVVSAFITGTVFNGIAMVAAVVACFFGQNKKEVKA